MEAVFFEAGMIRPGNPIKVRGVEVGQVREIAVDPSGEVVRIRFRIQDDVVLPVNPVVVLSPESMFGDWQAEIHSRTRFPRAVYTEPMEEGVLPGYTLPDISELTAAADQISDNLAVLTDRIGIAFSDETARNIASMIENIEGVSDRLSELVSQQARSFTEVTDGVLNTAGEIGAAAEQARATITRVDELLARTEVSSTLEDLGTVSANLRALSEELGGTNQEIRDMILRVDGTFTRAEEILAKVDEGDGTVSRLIEDPQMASEIEEMVTELKTLLQDIRENPRRYVRLSIF
jgi:phospholipid/cholesterol/gamma-HCH transport system substrate-binding protein